MNAADAGPVVSSRFDTHHDDLIHDVAYDFYGRRIATCSSDQKLKVWDFDAETGEWKLCDSWKAHDCSILKVVWAHPEYGQVIASCSFDRSVRIWEEQEQGSGRRWAEKARLVDSQGAVQNIAFAPNHVGLKLAASASEGVVRIYEAMEVMNLASWTLMEEFQVGSGGGKEAEGNYCISWCPSKFHPPTMVIGFGKEHAAKIFRMDQNNRWHAQETLPGHTDVVHDVAWAPSLGRSYQLIATACKDGRVRIFKLAGEPSRLVNGGASGISASPGPGKFRIVKAWEFRDHEAEVWRVEWNVTGTVLSSSGDDGRVRLWKANYEGEWGLMSVMASDQGSVDNEMVGH
ncbi:MAG: WD40-repeat-containing domain protein [Olpidium bornovanus]|uniref:WD40-repeat-containing domain protein n=1 Tax=Olpidium bornovanus TaxID=278681 RepID=A0A8H8DLP0_9FUNG|nr:MAG: WD40-repeat-containing domain protein [Olpidium bornovanus]